ncbi:MAG: metal-dependent hydrolase [Nitrososphaerota archaeon]|jgi:hypothetical protein|nr:metal-dependent hydrolase [Nitrososphaerota archaeon]
MALAYLLGKGASKVLRTKINIPLLLVLSILPDIDLVFEVLFRFPIHRGPTHSIVMALMVFIPFFIYYRKKSVPYFLGFISHFLIGDFIVGGQLMLLWPLSFSQFGLHELGFLFIDIYSPVNVALELSLFLIGLVVLIVSRDWRVFFGGDLSNFVLIIPLTTVLLPSTIGYPFTNSLFLVEPLLALAHIFYLVLFSFAVVVALCSFFRKKNKRCSTNM